MTDQPNQSPDARIQDALPAEQRVVRPDPINRSIELPGLVGEASKDRFLAATADNLLAVIIGVGLASLISEQGQVMRGAAFVVAYFAYFFVSEGALSTTIGKWTFGLRVRQLSGERCTWIQALLRTLLRPIEVNPVLAGGLPAIVVALLNKRRQRLGDIIARTVVVAV